MSPRNRFCVMLANKHQARRAEKKASTATFSTERKKQLDSHKKLVSNGRAADKAAGTKGVISLS
jgi:protein LTV1